MLTNFQVIFTDHGAVFCRHAVYVYIHCVSKKGYHPTTDHNFNNSCPIPVIFGTNIAEYMPSKGGLIYHLTYLLYSSYLGKP